MSIEDMTLTPISETDLSFSTTVEVGAQTTAEMMETVELSFSTLPGGAWDDRELIKSSQAAMSEFHAHHPGPGSWLDKATAALNAGKPLPGSEAFDTAWYTASAPVALIDETATQILGPIQPPNKKARRDKSKSNGNGNGNSNTIQNPYTNQQSQSQRVNGRESPTYTPPSPRLNANGDITLDIEENEHEDDEEEEEYDEDAEWDIDNEDYPTHTQSTSTFVPPTPAAPIPSPSHATNGIGPSPSLGVQPGVNRDDALGYAMTAQYWAGYWMGVAQSHSQGQGAGNAGEAQEASVPTTAISAASGSGSRSNKRSRQNQNQNQKQNGRSINGLLR